MLIAGSINNNDGQWNEPLSMARSIEQEMINDKIIDINEETQEAMIQRRKTIVAMARGVINHLKSNMVLDFTAGDLRNNGELDRRLPAVAKSFSVSAGNVSIGVGGIRPDSNSGIKIPPSNRTLTGKVK